jgi:acyl-CoA dehydrogenase
MVDFELTDEQRLMQKTAHEFAEREMRPVSLEYDKKGTVPGTSSRRRTRSASTPPSSPRPMAEAGSILS